jgi:hypothetical protein
MIYIQSDSERKLPHHFDCASALYGCSDLGYDFRLTSFEEVESGKFDMVIPNNLFIGSVEFMTEVFNRVNKFPDRLPNSNRETHIIKLSDAISRIESDEKLFVKPYQIKLFTGMVFEKIYLSMLNPYPKDTLVYVNVPFDSPILSEWRIYVKNGRMVDAKNYSGDWKIIPDWKIAENIIEDFTNKPICFTLDVAVLENGKTECVEFNDMWAIGNYGIPNDEYLSLLKNRYFEIINPRKN